MREGRGEGMGRKRSFILNIIKRSVYSFYLSPDTFNCQFKAYTSMNTIFYFIVDQNIFSNTLLAIGYVFF